jgi:hypothetical protein
LTGTIQMALMVTDILLLFDHCMIRGTILVFIGLNALLGIIILTDEHKRNKRRLRELID